MDESRVHLRASEDADDFLETGLMDTNGMNAGTELRACDLRADGGDWIVAIRGRSFIPESRRDWDSEILECVLNRIVQVGIPAAICRQIFSIGENRWDEKTGLRRGRHRRTLADKSGLIASSVSALAMWRKPGTPE